MLNPPVFLHIHVHMPIIIFFCCPTLLLLIAGKFGGDLNLAVRCTTAKLKSANISLLNLYAYVCNYVWRYRTGPPNLKSANIFISAALDKTANISSCTVHCTSFRQGVPTQDLNRVLTLEDDPSWSWVLYQPVRRRSSRQCSMTRHQPGK